MSKILSIRISGYGGEYTVGTLTDEQAEYWLDRDDDELCDHITDRHEFEGDPSCSIGIWYDNDNVVHLYGCKGNFNLTVSTDDKIMKEIEGDDFYDIEQRELDCIDTSTVESSVPYLICNTIEKGCFFHGNIELGDNEEFDISKLVLLTKEVFDETYIIGAVYDGLEIEDSGGDTDGKSFDYRIEYFD